MQSSLLAASPDPPSAAPDYAPFGQLARMLVPSAGSFAIYDAAGELAWCSDGFERPDLRALVDARAGEATRQPPTIEPTAAGVPAFVAPLDAPSGERLGCVVLELGSGHGPRQTSSMVASLLRPVLDCLVDRLSLERAVAAGGAPRESVLAVEDVERRSAGALDRLLRACVEQLKSDQGALLVPERGIRSVCAAGSASESARRILDATEKHILAWVRLNDRPLVVNRAARDAENQSRKILACPVRDAGGRVAGLVALFRGADAPDFAPADVRQLELAASKAVALLDSEYDRLTGLVDRPTFERQVERSLAAAPAAPHALLYFDVDRLQLVNDALGFQAGDEAIRRVAAAIRAEAAPEDVVSRVGGDRLAMLVPGVDAARAAERGRRILAALAADGYVDRARTVPLSACCGAVDTADGTRRASHLLAAAELACKRAKRFGRGRVHVAHGADPLAAAERNRALAVADLHEALARGGFRLLAQPIVPLREPRAPHALELLLRLANRDGELVEPEKFFDAAERHQLLGALDRWVLRTLGERAAADAPALAEAGVRLMLNVSAHSLADPEFPAFVLETLARAGVPPALLCFEIREPLAQHRRGETEAFASALGAAGSSIALDGCGSGQGVLGDLERLHVSALKLDGALVRRIESDPVAESIVTSIAAAGRDLGVPTIAQHVETAAVAERLAALGIEFGQGYHLGRPEPLDERLAALVSPSQ